ncbi:Hypothetical Protein FCC1311_024342 [Hondaea fermentalgiana]|uniref:Uncharacterized protein n=1 Tax=Hondaea fermentalgiana TaxID=2315210 RepID=A0A2R5GCA4_9STRA|nr:Hypothetical Protein FCC1311_024342 [Hondaea fermentalgiana]|eukprot:GBG26213.1 Hypothetical Protein FCC1311_024342 [Hondaea fermentalgiana]
MPFKARPPSAAYPFAEQDEDEFTMAVPTATPPTPAGPPPRKASSFLKRPSMTGSGGGSLFKRPPSMPGSSFFKARPPSMAHPDDMPPLEDATVVKDKKGNIVKRMGNQVHKQIRKKHACERAFMCALAVSLLWLTSLVVAKEVTHLFIPTPTQATVSDSTERMFEITQDQRAAYKACATEVSEECTISFARDKTNEEDRIRTIQTAIEDRLEEIKDEVILCSEAFIDANEKLNDASSVTSNVDETGTCGETDISEFLSSEALAAGAVADLEAYKGSTDETVNGLSDQLAARALYDLQFMDNKTNNLFSSVVGDLTGNLTDPQAVIDAIDQSFSEFMACVSTDGTYTKQNGASVSCSETTIFGKARTRFDSMKGEYEEMLDRARVYRNSIEAKMANYQSLYDFCVSVQGVLSAAGFSAGLVYVSGISLDFADSLGNLVSAQYDSLSNLVDPNPEEVYDDMLAQANGFMSQVYTEADLIAASNALYEGNTTALLQVFFDDYNPPYVNETLLDEQRRSSATIVGDVADELDSVSSEENGTSSIEEFIDEAQVNVSEASASLLNKADPREWSDVYSYSDDVFNQVYNGITDVNDLALAFDYAYRILRSIMLIRKYWNISAINTPPADVRTKRGIAAGVFQAKANPMQKIGNILTNPVFNIAIIILFLGLFGAAFYGTYSPIYNEYTNNCVDKCFVEIKNSITGNDGELLYNTTANGTMLYRNSYALAEQYAFSDGDYVANTEIDSIGVNMELSCRDSTIDSISLRLNQDDRLEYYNTRAADLSGKIEYLRSCVDFDAIETANGWTDEFSNLVRDSALESCVRTFPPFEEYLQTLNLQVLSLDRIYDCDQIAPCDFQCSGPSEPILRGVTFDTSCTMEWYLHAELLTFFCALLGYITTNLARMIFLNGIVKISWRHLSSHKFAIIASCREDGTMIYPEDVTVKGESFRKVIVKQLRIAIRAFERRGCAITLFGISLIVPWFAILITLRRSLAFDSDRICDL